MPSDSANLSDPGRPSRRNAATSGWSFRCTCPRTNSSRGCATTFACSSTRKANPVRPVRQCAMMRGDVLDGHRRGEDAGHRPVRDDRHGEDHGGLLRGLPDERLPAQLLPAGHDVLEVLPVAVVGERPPVAARDVPPVRRDREDEVHPRVRVLDRGQRLGLLLALHRGEGGEARRGPEHAHVLVDPLVHLRRRSASPLACSACSASTRTRSACWYSVIPPNTASGTRPTASIVSVVLASIPRRTRSRRARGAVRPSGPRPAGVLQRWGGSWRRR